MAQSPPSSGDLGALRSVHTTNLPNLFDQLRISLVVPVYQAGKAAAHNLRAADRRAVSQQKTVRALVSGLTDQEDKR